MNAQERMELLKGLEDGLAQGVVPHNTALGLVAVEADEGVAVMKLPYQAKLVGNPETGILHGGAVTATLDATSGLATFLAMKEPSRIATLDLRIDYMGAGEPGRDVLVRAHCYKLTKNVAFTRAVAYHDDPDDPIAAASGSFMIFHGEDSASSAGLKKS